MQLSAQTNVVIKGGYSYNDLASNGASKNFESIKPLGGYFFSAQVNIKTLGGIAVNSGIELIQKKHFWSRSASYAGVYQRHRNIYLQLPLAFQMRLAKMKRLECYITSGMFGGYWVTRLIEGTIPNAFNTTFEAADNGEIVQHFHLSKYTVKNKFDRSRDNRFEFGVLAGIQLNYCTAKSLSPSLSIDYYHAFTYLEQKYLENQNRQRNRTVTLSLGILYKMK